MTDLDPAMRAVQVERADALRRDANDLLTRSLALEAQAKLIERTWQIPAPCILCGRRQCSH